MSLSFQMEKGGSLMLPSMQIFLDVRSHVKCKFHLEVMPDWPTAAVAVYEKVRGRLPLRIALTLTVMALPSDSICEGGQT